MEKNFKTINEQVEILKNKGLIIEDENVVKDTPVSYTHLEVIIMIIKYASYLGLYLCARKKNLTSDSFILSIAIIQGFFLSFEMCIRDRFYSY